MNRTFTYLLLILAAIALVFIYSFGPKPLPAKKITKEAPLEDIFPVYPGLNNVDQMLGVKFIRTVSIKPNKIQPSLTDTFVNCKYGKSVIGLGKIDGDDIFWFANINDKKIRLHNGICIGMSKKDFSTKTKIELETACDTLQINCGCAADASVKYIFQKQKLKTILYFYPID